MKQLKIFLGIFSLGLLFFANFVLADTSVDSFDVTPTGVLSVDTGGTLYMGQSFTASTTYTMTSVALNINSCGSVTHVVIYDASSQFPTGSPLLDQLFTCSTGWDKILLGSPISIVSGNQYAITMYNATESLIEVYSSDLFSGGQQVRSTNSGSTWGTYDYDLLFRTYTDDVGGGDEGTSTASTTSGSYPWTSDDDIFYRMLFVFGGTVILLGKIFGFS
jgi:hypothetical protein